MRIAKFAAVAAGMLAVLGMAPPPRITLHLIGDSTMANKGSTVVNPERGWGQLLPTFLDDEIVVRNHAMSGRSSKSFIDEGRWEHVRAALRPGDYVLVQFGHNDAKRGDSLRYTDPHTGFRSNLERFVDETRARGANPVILSPIVRRHFDAHGVLQDTHGAYPVVARQVAREKGVTFIDLQHLTEHMVRRAGREGSKRIYVWLAPGTNLMYPEGREDDTHLSFIGAREVARLAARALAERVPALASHVRGAW
jgi:lysophospholipase L1-like esterase